MGIAALNPSYMLVASNVNKFFNQPSASSLSDLKNRSENSAGRGQILPVLQVNSRSIDQKSGKICTGQADLQPISFKSDRLLDNHPVLPNR